jgi:MGT family glycosyltransferase
MKILLINLPYYGHVVPTIGLVQELIRLGCEVTYLLPFDWEETIKVSGAVFSGYQNHRQLAEQIKNAYAAAEKIAAQFDLILYEQFFFLGKHLSEQYQKPAVRIFTAPATNKALMQEFIDKGPMSIFKHKWIARAFTKDIAKDIPMKTGNWLDEIIENPPALNLVYTLRQYQPYEEEFPDAQYQFLGPSIYERPSPPLDFTKGSKPLVYISLGTVIKGKASFFRCCVEAFRHEEVDVILSVGNQFDTKKLKHLPPNIHVYKSVPQTEVLKITDVFVTHGGMNSICEAFASAVPMVVIPFVSDQPVNAHRIEALGAGKQLEPKSVNKETLRNAVLSVLSDPSIQGNLTQIQQWVLDAPGNRGGAEAVIRYYLEQSQSHGSRAIHT